MELERNKSNIDSNELAYIIWNGKETFDHFKRYVDELHEVGYIADAANLDKSRVELYYKVQEQAERFKKVKSLDFMADEVPPWFLFSNSLHIKGSVGLLMAIHLVKVMGTDQQVRDWAQKIADREWYACYVQTELGHGSDVQNLKTTAVYDPDTKQFEIHSPDVDSIKWWPGDLGMSATHGVIMVRVFSLGKDLGILPLFIQLRDLKTHVALPGLEIGDIGPKLGYRHKDNGFLRFNHFKAPKNALLGKYYELSDDGSFEIKGNTKMIYASMMESRKALLSMHSLLMYRAITIVGRYSCMRKQFKDDNGNEIRIIDYQLQKYKIMRSVSRCYAMRFSLLQLEKFLKKNMNAVKAGNYDYLQETHIYLCAYKAYFTWTSCKCFSELIQAAGGHGYNMYSGLPGVLLELFADSILEGENSLLCLQVSRHLLKNLRLVQSGEGDKVKGATQYLRDKDSLIAYALPDDKDGICNSENLLRTMGRAASYFVQRTALKFMSFTQEGLGAKETWDYKVGVDLLNMGKIHMVYSIAFESFMYIKSIQNASLREILLDVHQFFIIETIEEYAMFFVESSSITPEQMSILKERREELVDSLSPHLLKLCEGAQFDERLMWSAIADKNETPYENLFNWANQFSSLNKYRKTGHPSYQEQKM